MKVLKINKCRLCGSSNLVKILELGNQALTGVFPGSTSKEITVGPLNLVKCHGNASSCGLVQLEHSYELEEMYGDNYGYRSGLNKSMSRHLREKVDEILDLINLEDEDLIIDIGSNDGTTLGFFPEKFNLIGVDPTAEKFRKYYRDDCKIVTKFFSKDNIEKYIRGKKAKVITSFSMLYDLEDPIKFAKDVKSVLDPVQGIWVFEQSYLPLMLKTINFDTVCHEHIEYYGLKQLSYIANKAGLKIIDAKQNDINGGSISVVACNKDAIYDVNQKNIMKFKSLELEMNLDGLEVYKKFKLEVEKAKTNFLQFLKREGDRKKIIAGLGASTKGNVLLQYFGISSSEIKYIGEVNHEKFGKYTPGTNIKIICEDDLLKLKPDYLVVLPWHFKDFFIKNKKFKGFKLVFPLPSLEIITVN